MLEVVKAALKVAQEFHFIGNEVFDADGATFVRNKGTPKIRDANLVTRVTTSTLSETNRLLSRVEREFEDFPYRNFSHLDPSLARLTEAAIALEGYQATEALLMLLEGDLTADSKQHDIRTVTGDADWIKYAELRRLDWQEYALGAGEPTDDETSSQMVRSRRLKSPTMEYWMAYVDGQPFAYCTSWKGSGRIGMVEDLFTHPEFRHRGLATALIDYCVARCRVQGALQVIIAADVDDTPKNMYSAMGFRHIAVIRGYWKSVGHQGLESG